VVRFRPFSGCRGAMKVLELRRAIKSGIHGTAIALPNRNDGGRVPGLERCTQPRARAGARRWSTGRTERRKDVSRVST
jgi:hypothetical protein